jgi:hypothetical protein
MTIRITGSLRVSADADSDGAQKAFADLTPEERERCKKFWEKFKTLERTQLGSLLLLVLLPWASNRFHVGIPGVVAVGLLIVFLVSHVWIYALDCPRCRATFSGGLIALLPRVRYPWSCYGCDLNRRQLKYISQRVHDLN